jgi:hypothetical protein
MGTRLWSPLLREEQKHLLAVSYSAFGCAIEGSLQFNGYENRAAQNMGQLYCHTKPPSGITLRYGSPGSMPVCNRTGFRRSNALLRR